MTDPLPKVSVICAWYNRADYIRDTVDSLLAQDFDGFEVVIINDGSPDPRVREILDSYDDPRLRVVHQENTGFTFAIRKAIAASSGDYVSIMGAGDKVRKNKLRKQLEYLLANPEAGAVGCGHNLVSAATGRKIRYVSPVPKISSKNVDILRRKVPFTHGTVVYRRKILMDAGNYDTFFRIAQDRDLYWRIAKISEIHGVDEALYEKLIFEDGVTFTPAIVVYKGFYSQLARSQDRAKIEYFKANPDEIPQLSEMYSAKYLRYSIRKFLALMVRREWKLAAQWMSLARKQFLNLIHNMIRIDPRAR
jgi:glycosyltransferase involved in cell wall biosynthesis